MKITFFLLFVLVFSTIHAQKQPYQTPEISGGSIHTFNPNQNDDRLKEDSSWYTNDHCFIKDKDGLWHAYGIIGHKPVNPWVRETKFFHISAKSLRQTKWKEHDYALTAKPGVERVLWAPHIIEKNGNYFMFYNIGNMLENAPDYASWGQLCLATSKDLFKWIRHDRNPLFSDPGHARDSYVMKCKGQYFYYYTRIFNEVDQRSSVAVRTSPDLLNWSGPKIVHVQPFRNNWGMQKIRS